MVDRKSESEGSGPHPSRSGSLRISASSSSRVVNTGKGASAQSKAPSSPPGDDSALDLRSNSMVLLVAAVCTTAFTITGLVRSGASGLGTSSILFLVTCAICWAAFFLRERGRIDIWAGLIGVSALSALFTTEQLPSAIVLASTLLILTWSALLLKPAYNAVLAAFAFVATELLAGKIMFVGSQMEVEPVGEFALPVLLIFVLVPLGFGAALQVRERSLEARAATGVRHLQEQRDELERRLENKNNELKLASEQLFEAQKLKMVGTMAAGLAHELNNILTPIRGHAELIAEGDHKLEQTRRYGQRILDSAVAAAQITQALLTYAHKDTFQPVRSNLRQILQSTILPVLSKTLPNNVRLNTELDRSVSVDVDRHLFQQAIVNLVFNACDAMPSGGEIVIGLSTSPEYPGEKTEHGDEPHDGSDRSALVTVSDSGTGIEDEHLQQIFDPFFTTKAVGSGSGLGLAMVMGTVTRHQGRIGVKSEVGKGTTFMIYLPLAATDDRSDAHKPWPVLRGDAKGPVVVVLTEDQDALDEFEELLEATECAPICTNDAKGATPLLTEMGDKVDLLILDLEIEATDGKRLFKTVRELFPELPVILISDQPTDPIIQRMIVAGPTRSVRKPMDNRLFSALLTDLLNPGGDGFRDAFTPVPINPNSSADVSGPHTRAGA